MKKIIDFFIIVIVCGICLTGCGKGKKVSDKQDFKVDGISEIHVRKCLQITYASLLQNLQILSCLL